jgi:hypothetical protein
VAISFIGVGKPEYPEKTTNLPQVTDKLDHIMLYWKLVKVQLRKAYLEHCMVFAMAVGGIGELKINISTT